MTREEIDYVLTIVEEQVVRARKLGGYSTEAESIMIMWEVLLKITRHLQEKTPRKRNDPNSKTDD
jgi:hypothetical protein